jgi:hypothetical protein
MRPLEVLCRALFWWGEEKLVASAWDVQQVEESGCGVDVANHLPNIAL